MRRNIHVHIGTYNQKRQTACSCRKRNECYCVCLSVYLFGDSNVWRAQNEKNHVLNVYQCFHSIRVCDLAPFIIIFLLFIPFYFHLTLLLLLCRKLHYMSLNKNDLFICFRFAIAGSLFSFVICVALSLPKTISTYNLNN